MDPQFLESLQSIALSMRTIAKRLDAIAVPIALIAESTKRLDPIAGALITFGEQAETLIAATVSQSRRVEGLIGDLIEVSSLPQKTELKRDRSGRIIEATRTIDASSEI